MVRVYTKDVGEVRDVIRKECECKWQLEDGINELAKREFGVQDE